MAFIGNTPQTQAFTPAIDYFSGNGSTTAFTLSRPVASVAQVQAFIENVPQNPSTAFTVSGSTITFTSAPLSGTNNIYVEYTSPITQVNALSQAPSVVGPMNVSINSAASLAGATNPVVTMNGSSNNYIQSYVYNSSTGTSASSDFTAYPNNGSDASGWVDMGITSSNYSNATYGITGANEGYLFMSAPSGASKTGNLVIATDSTGTQNAIKFATNGFGSTTERMRIDSSGYVGIGASPAAKFEVVDTSGATGSVVRIRNSSINTNFVDRRSVSLTNIIAWTTLLTITSSSVSGTWYRGVIKCTMGGHTSTVGNGALIDSIYYFDLNNTTLTAGSVSAGTASGSNPSFRVQVSGSTWVIQFQSYNGTNRFDGVANLEILCPIGAGNAPAFTIT